jgi:ATP-dependent Zn protease
MGVALLRRAILTASITVLLGLSAVSVVAQTPTAAPTTGGTFTGKITKTNPLTVNSNGQDRQVNATGTTAIVRDGKTATLNDPKVGDQVNVSSNPDNTVAKIETTGTAKSGSSIWKWLIPLLIALLVLGLIAYLLSRRKKDDFVLERDRTNNTTTDRTNAPRA